MRSAADRPAVTAGSVRPCRRSPRLTATAPQTVGSKGYDGFLMALVTGWDAG